MLRRAAVRRRPAGASYLTVRYPVRALGIEEVDWLSEFALTAGWLFGTTGCLASTGGRVTPF
ncbi:hypothetical protein Cci01nite_64530 [Catellatospora citrea]|uniref:Uncharacterized protein n=1 Tax=Catellatospora citrea TaxID=53366 RepID=A0A8J3KSW4_9ACTN|nr:hypothetical protein Cci01nite_64530 [Catellatospora citrea]